MTTPNYTPGAPRPMPAKDEWALWDVASGMVDPAIQLVHPLSPDFGVTGSGELTPQEWAVERRLMYVRGVARCAHGLYAMGACPAICGDNIGLDHTSVWTHTTGELRPFILTQPYAEEIPPKMLVYAEYHGLRARVSEGEGDGWYGFGTLPIQLDMAYPSSFAWPLQAKITQLLAIYPPRWEGADDVFDAARQRRVEEMFAARAETGAST